MKPLSIYIHIPFCVSKCAYCDFVSTRIGDFELNEGIKAYIEALKLEIESYRELLSESLIETIYFGGGTPSAIDGRYIREVIERLKSYSKQHEKIEITVEVNPGTLNQEKMNHYLAAGVNRISMGLQTTNDTLLKAIGRIHSTNDFLTSYNALKEAGFNNLNLDLMFGLPGQTIQDIERAIHLVSTLKPMHVSAYGLKIEEGTPLFHAYEAGHLTLPDEVTERDMYHLIVSSLENIGIVQYELSNFAVPGFESKHNLTYWKNRPYLGLGVSSHSKIDHRRFCNASDIVKYVEALKTGKSAIIENDIIAQDEDLFETIILGLRLNEGIDMSVISSAYHVDFEKRYHQVIEKCVKDGLVFVQGQSLKLTERGRDLANQVFLDFMIEL